MKELKGYLRSPGRSRRRVESKLDFGAHTVAVFFSAQILGEEKIIERRFPVGSDGAFQLMLSDNALADAEARLAVMAPSGEVAVLESLAEVPDCHCEVLPPPQPDAEELANQGASYSQNLG